MNDVLVRSFVGLNALANALGQFALAPLAYLPGWISATLVAAVTGLVMLIAFKYTSNQRAIKRARDDIKANLLALKLFKDSAVVALRCQGRIVRGAGRLLLLALAPMLAMFVPILLLMGQLAAWYQVRPLAAGEQAVVTLQLGGAPDAPWPEVALEPNPAIVVTTGPVRVLSQRAIFWNVQAKNPSTEPLVFAVGTERLEKQLAVAGQEDVRRTSPLRPGWNWLDVLMYPAERPFPAGAVVQSIAIDYPNRYAWTYGTDWWMAYWLIASMLAAFCLKRPLNVNL